MIFSDTMFFSLTTKFICNMYRVKRKDRACGERSDNVDYFGHVKVVEDAVASYDEDVVIFDLVHDVVGI